MTTLDALPVELLAPLAILLPSLYALYRKRGTLTLTMINSRQWGLIKRLIDGFRKTFFAKTHDRRHVEVDASLDEVRTALLEAHFVEWDLAYFYEGEVLNMRRGCLVRGSQFPKQQDHVRAFVDDGTLTLSCHRETRPEAHPEAHLDSHNLRHPEAVAAVTTALRNAGIEYRRL